LDSIESLEYLEHVYFLHFYVMNMSDYRLPPTKMSRETKKKKLKLMRSFVRIVFFTIARVIRETDRPIRSMRGIIVLLYIPMRRTKLYSTRVENWGRDLERIPT